MKTKWVIAIALTMWATGVASHAALVAVIPQETVQQQQCTRPQCCAPAPAMSAMCTPATKGARPLTFEDLKLIAELEDKFENLKKDDEEIGVLIDQLKARE